MSATHWTWLLIAVATSAVILRPWRLPEALWAVAGALALVVLQLLAPAQAWAGVRRGDDVYLFLAGMMLGETEFRHQVESIRRDLGLSSAADAGTDEDPSTPAADEEASK